MAKYRKKPVVIEAEQFFHTGHLPEGVECVCAGNNYSAYIKTLEGVMIVTDGDWIITGIVGEKYPCKPDIFEQTYERVD